MFNPIKSHFSSFSRFYCVKQGSDSPLSKRLPIGFIGGGSMATALGNGFIGRSLMSSEQIYFYDQDQKACDKFLDAIKGAKLLNSNQKVVEKANIIFLAVKPQNIQEVADDLVGKNKEGKLFISILAGASLNSLYDHIQTKRIIRVMPNTPCLIAEGASAYSLGAGATKEDGMLVDLLLKAVGIAFEVKEPDLDIVTATSGVGPAIALKVMKAIENAAVLLGLNRKVARPLIIQTFIGAAKMLLETGQHPNSLIDQVASPGGTTAAALRALENGKLEATLIDAVDAGTKRARELDRLSKTE